jgi:hypothetical protein
VCVCVRVHMYVLLCVFAHDCVVIAGLV